MHSFIRPRPEAGEGPEEGVSTAPEYIRQVYRCRIQAVGDVNVAFRHLSMLQGGERIDDHFSS